MPSTQFQPSDASAKTLDELARDCATETELFFRGSSHDSPDCFELFRRALDENCQQAWDLIYSQYLPLVIGWVAKHPELPRSGGDIRELADRAFERMWAAWAPDKFRRFRDLRALLAYLKTCVHSVVIEEFRRAGPNTRTITLSDLPEDALDALTKTASRSAEGEILQQERNQELWDLVAARLRDDKERLVLHCLFVLGLKPAGILACCRDAFRDTREIYLIRQVVLERLSRDAQLKVLLGLDA